MNKDWIAPVVGVGFFLGYVLVWALVVGGLVYAAAHFIHKFW